MLKKRVFFLQSFVEKFQVTNIKNISSLINNRDPEANIWQ